MKIQKSFEGNKGVHHFDTDVQNTCANHKDNTVFQSHVQSVKEAYQIATQEDCETDLKNKIERKGMQVNIQKEPEIYIQKKYKDEAERSFLTILLWQILLKFRELRQL
ncbi:hypothetical protein J0S82_000858, partial [Galemys pyrenaicus]